ncbi:MAG: hypothetical protein ACYC9Y_12055 [Candidatus Methylomirabilia bacterium]
MGKGEGKGDRFIFLDRSATQGSGLRRKINLSPFSLALLAALLCSTAGCGAAVCRDVWFGPDKARHFAAGFAIGAAASTLAGHQGWSPAGSAALGLGTVAAAGGVKETADLNGAAACWSWKDFAWDLLGGAAGTALGTAAGH